jgi:hypothetical protein
MGSCQESMPVGPLRVSEGPVSGGCRGKCSQQLEAAVDKRPYSRLGYLVPRPMKSQTAWRRPQTVARISSQRHRTTRPKQE